MWKKTFFVSYCRWLKYGIFFTDIRKLLVDHGLVFLSPIVRKGNKLFTILEKIFTNVANDVSLSTVSWGTYVFEYQNNLFVFVVWMGAFYFWNLRYCIMIWEACGQDSTDNDAELEWRRAVVGHARTCFIYAAVMVPQNVVYL